jgi:large subunit ribosomal protein L13
MIIYASIKNNLLEEKAMSTYMPKAGDITRSWYIIDAEGKTLGHVAAKAADLLRGKHKPTFTPNADCGDHVIIINADKVVLTGKKLDQKMYYHHTGYIGNMKEVKYSTLMKTKPEFAMQLAVKGMLPDSTLGRNALGRLRIYKGAEHKHAAQKPEEWAL